MNDINEMPPVCAYCPYWELCKPPYICPDIGDKEPKRTEKRTETHASDLIDRAEAIDAVYAEMPGLTFDGVLKILHTLPSVQPERKWTSCSNPPKHHKDVIVRGIEAIGNVTVHKVMQWDVDTWRPTDYAPSVMWKEWSEI